MPEQKRLAIKLNHNLTILYISNKCKVQQSTAHYNEISTFYLMQPSTKLLHDNTDTNTNTI